ncbi:hypothetical protein LWM68_15755 [Niabella sp. W65]|nr:hypothetical protein [Niabella sp. W65]MCH7364081.1 hypothetical protein [Niabella sp. W65]ULT39960.1 hypothetical protein KRR40_34575 [Niabella sp. I65]
MKKLKLTIVALAIAAGAFATYSFTNPDAEVPTISSSTELHWFDEDGEYIGTNTIEDQELACPGEGNVCATGYDSESGGSPVGPLRYTAQKN